MLTDSAKAKRREYKRQWAQQNPDKVRAAQERYWERKAAESDRQPEVKDGGKADE